MWKYAWKLEKKEAGGVGGWEKPKAAAEKWRNAHQISLEQKYFSAEQNTMLQNQKHHLPFTPSNKLISNQQRREGKMQDEDTTHTHITK